MDKQGLNDYENDVLEAIDNFKRVFKSKASDLQDSFNIKDLESMLSELVAKTNKVYLDMTSDMLSEYIREVPSTGLKNRATSHS